MATQDEIEKLKNNWLADPIFDLEDTEGFAEHYDELLKFREETEANWQLEEEERVIRRARVVEVETGVTASGAVQSIRTYAEIEHWVNHPEKQALSIEDTIAAAQVHATLLVAAQIQRIADALEAQNANDQVDFMTRLYKAD